MGQPRAAYAALELIRLGFLTVALLPCSSRGKVKLQVSGPSLALSQLTREHSSGAKHLYVLDFNAESLPQLAKDLEAKYSGLKVSRRPGTDPAPERHGCMMHRDSG